jgi:predicted DNA-binding transcriptional regulator YafY
MYLRYDRRMKSSRLLSLVLLLQQRPRSSASALAAALEVTTRTVLRDIDALSAAGVPVWAERGRNGGFSIDPAWGAKVSGLTEAEAQALLVADVPRIASELGLGEQALHGRLKLLASLPKHMRSTVERYGARLHVDPVDWYRADEQPALLNVVARAVWADEAISVRYRSWRAERDRELEPLGLVLKAGVWYLLARQTGDGQARTFRVANFKRVAPTERVFVRPRGFDLATAWRDNLLRFERELRRVRAQVRVSQVGLDRLRNMRMPHTLTGSAPDANGWVEAALLLESIDAGARQLLALGAELHVHEPHALREELARVASEIAVLNAP